MVQSLEFPGLSGRVDSCDNGAKTQITNGFSFGLSAAYSLPVQF